MTIATDLGFKLGELYRVVDSAGNANLKDGMIVKFIFDDGSSVPLFSYISGPIGSAMGYYANTYIKLKRLVPVEPAKSSLHTQELPPAHSEIFTKQLDLGSYPADAPEALR